MNQRKKNDRSQIDESSHERGEEKEKHEEYEEHHKHSSKIESRRTRGGKGYHSHLINSDSTRVMDLSHKQLRGGKTLTRMKENANRGGEGDRAPSSYLTGITQS
jgi:hypothetical protein